MTPKRRFAKYEVTNVANVVNVRHSTLCGRRKRPYANLQTTVYPSKSIPITPKLQQNPFRTIPNKKEIGEPKVRPAICFTICRTYRRFHSCETLRKRSGTLRNHPETFRIVLKCPETSRNVRKTPQNIRKSCENF